MIGLVHLKHMIRHFARSFVVFVKRSDFTNANAPNNVRELIFETDFFGSLKIVGHEIDLVTHFDKSPLPFEGDKAEAQAVEKQAGDLQPLLSHGVPYSPHCSGSTIPPWLCKWIKRGRAVARPKMKLARRSASMSSRSPDRQERSCLPPAAFAPRSTFKSLKTNQHVIVDYSDLEDGIYIVSKY